VSAAEAQAVRPIRTVRTVRLLTPYERGRRNRRTIDGVLLAVAAAATGLAAAAAYAAPAQDNQVAKNVIAVLGWAEPLWRTAFVAALALAALVVVVVLYRRRWDLLRDIVVALALGLVLAVLLGRAVVADWLPFGNHLLSNWGFPEVRIAGVTAVLVVVAPEIVRPMRRLAVVLVLLAALASVVLGAALPSAALGALALGIGAAAIVRLAFGTAAGFPPAETIRTELAMLGIETRDLAPAERQRIGCTEYVGHDGEGRPVNARVLGRDAQDTQRISRRWRSLAYRDPRRSAPVGRLEQVEHEALATVMAAQAGVRVPEVVTATLGSQGDALVVTRRPDIDPLEDAAPGTVTDELLRALWKEVAKLHASGMSHGRLNGRNIAVVDGKPVLIDFSVATLGAPPTAIDIDVAELLVATTVLVGPDRALDSALHGAGAAAVKGAIPFLERAALTPHVRDLAHDHEVELKALREKAAAATHEKVPELVPLRRVRARDFLYTALVALAAYLLITKLAKIGFGTIYHELRSSDLAWVAVAFVLANLTYIPQAVALRGAVPTPLPFGPCVAVQSAVKFLNLTVPGSAGSIALSIRFLQKQGAETGEAVASGAIVGLSDTIVQILLIVCLLPFVRLHFDTKQLSGALPSGTFVAVIFAILAVAVVAVLTVPALRRRVVPQIRSAFHALWEVARSGHKLVQLFGGSLAAEVLFALTLGAASRAYGLHLPLAQLILVNVVASSLAGLVPVPGGIGAAEAAIAGGLVALGVPESTAFAVALTHRLATYYTPPIWGYFSLRWLRRTGHV
jgi:glycosyltransferase 2 family protein